MLLVIAQGQLSIYMYTGDTTGYTVIEVEDGLERNTKTKSNV